jgi:hypothetical protein
MKEIKEYLQDLKEIFPDCIVYDNQFMLWDLYDDVGRQGIHIHPITRNDAGELVSHAMLAWTLCGHTVLHNLAIELKKRMSIDSNILGFVIFEDRQLQFTTHPDMLNFNFSA